MRLLKTLQGDGTVTTKAGHPTLVRYYLQIYQAEVPAGTYEHPHNTIPGMQEIRGKIEPVCSLGDDELTLELNDRRKMAFFFTDSHGNIAFREWIV